MTRSAALTLSIVLAAAPAAAQTAAPDAPTSALAARYANARRLDGQTEYEAAATAFEGYAEACLASSTAVLHDGEPCAATGPALERAFVLRRALGHRERASQDAEAYVAHFLYAEPRAAIRVRYEVARMFLEAGELAHATAAIEALGRTRDAPVGLTLVADGLRAQVAHRRGEARVAARAWRRVERGWAAHQAELELGGAVPARWVREAVAEGRLLRAERSVDRYLAVRGVRRSRIDDPARWWSEVMSPWLVRSRRRLLIARAELERVYELGSPRHSVIAAARIGEMYEHRADLHAELELPDSDVLRALVSGGDASVGYDTAREHLETCVRWASHHGVAREWAERCEAHLHALDPERYPRAAELYRESPFLPVAHAPPPDVDERRNHHR